VDFIRKWVRLPNQHSIVSADVCLLIYLLLLWIAFLRVRFVCVGYLNSTLTPHYLVFPGGFLPSLTVLISSLERGTSGKLVVDSVSNIGPHYARTLREWRNRFEAKFDEVIVPALRRTYPDTMGLGPKPKTLTNIADDEIAVFRRKWLYY
jgi:hypothetical protein